MAGCIKVNGNFPEYGASSYRLKDGDKIEWRFYLQTRGCLNAQ